LQDVCSELADARLDPGASLELVRDSQSDERYTTGTKTMAKRGWYPDPAGDAQLRYFDGRNWTERTQPFPEPVGTPVEPVAHDDVGAPQSPINPARETNEKLRGTDVPAPRELNVLAASAAPRRWVTALGRRRPAIAIVAMAALFGALAFANGAVDDVDRTCRKLEGAESSEVRGIIRDGSGADGAASEIHRRAVMDRCPDLYDSARSARGVQAPVPSSRTQGSDSGACSAADRARLDTVRLQASQLRSRQFDLMREYSQHGGSDMIEHPAYREHKQNEQVLRTLEQEVRSLQSQC
jgi:hypothetical protein